MAKGSFKSNENLWVAGVKIIADGSPHCGTSAIREGANGGTQFSVNY